MSRLIEPNIAMSIKPSSNSTTSTASSANSLPSSPTISSTSALKSDTLEEPTESVQKTVEAPNILLTSENVVVSLIAGAAAGGIAKSAIAPLDRTKINFQISRNVPYSFNAAVLFLKTTYQKEGVFALWRGNSATMARILPYAAIQYTAHEQWRNFLRVDQDGKNTKGRRFIAGSLAGITSQSLTYPLDLARARMAVTDKYTGYKTLRQVFVRIWVDEGPRILYRGYWATILGVIPYAGTSFFTYETLKREYNVVTGNAKPNTLVSLAFGAAAGVAGQTASYPLDIVRRRMQTSGLKKDTVCKYQTLIGTLTAIYKEEGIKKGFYKGLSMNWIKGPIAVGISFSTYDFIKELLRELIYLKRGRQQN